jgi:hypothetical protein
MSTESNIASNPQNNLSSDVAHIHAEANKLHNVNWWQNYILGVLALLSSIAVVVAGMYEQGKLSALFGLFTSFLLAFERFDPSDAKAQFYREIRAQAKCLLRDLQDNSKKPEDIRAVLDILELNLAKQIPRQGLGDAIKELNKSLSRSPR